MIGDGNQRILLPDMAGVEQYVEDYTKPAIADEVEEEKSVVEQICKIIEKNTPTMTSRLRTAVTIPKIARPVPS